MSIDLEGSVCDSEAARLLPWFVNGRLSAQDAERVTRHIEHCAICRADLAEQRSLRSSLRTDGPVEYAPQAGLAQTLARIDELNRDVAAAADNETGRETVPWRRRYGVTQWLAAAVVIQAVGLGVLASAHFAGSRSDHLDAAYQTLATTAPTANGPRIRAVFSGATSVSELAELLAAQHLVVVAGPTDAGVFTLRVSDSALNHERLDDTLAALRADGHVLFAEPASADGAPPR